MDAGVGVLTLAALRFVLLALLLGGWHLLRHRIRPFRPRDVAEMSGMGLLTGVITCANLLAIQHIPVSVATLVFYTYPLMTVALALVVFREPVSKAVVLCMAFALAGLGVALQVQFDTLSPTGIAWSTLAAVSSAALFVWSRVLMTRVSAMELTMVSAASGGIALFVLLAILDVWALPTTAEALVTTTLVSALFVIAYSTMYAAVAAAGPVNTSMLMNVEPVVAIGAAVVLLGERLTGAQVVGALLVVSAITIMQLLAARPATRA